ncbi:MAG TPA: glycosyltransferase [Desulfurella acetivorans]|uniref:Glycosyltransferase n=1 Tax=Desulfurella acetivorans TaxID=33002 RepID=A0A7C6E7R5_DESAE|nr:glycosyltransferase [Desulfurella acetivorans]
MPLLHERLLKVLNSQDEHYEIIYVDDGSKDNSLNILKNLKGNTKVVELARNYGQHAAIFAGFSVVSGDKVITMDADLQNPPEEIPKILEKFNEGYDVIATVRQQRKDSIFRKFFSHLNNYITKKITKVDLNDWGCMLRGYRKKIVERMLNNNEKTVFIPVIATYYTKNIIEIPIQHSQRQAGKSKYSLIKLINLMFDLMTSFSNLPLEILLYGGIVTAAFGILLGIVLALGRAFYGVEWALGGVFSLFSVLFVLIGAQFFAFGILGEYIGRIYKQVKNRPVFVIENIYDSKEDKQ